jgi:hypothetical protein
MYSADSVVAIANRRRLFINKLSGAGSFVITAI